MVKSTPLEIQARMDELVAKWKDKPEPAKFSREWFTRRADRSVYIMYQCELKKSSDFEKKSAEQMAKDIGLIQ